MEIEQPDILIQIDLIDNVLLVTSKEKNIARCESKFTAAGRVGAGAGQVKSKLQFCVMMFSQPYLFLYPNGYGRETDQVRGIILVTDTVTFSDHVLSNPLC